MLKKVKQRAREKLILDVSTTRDDLNAAIKMDGRCTPDRCMHKVAIARILFEIDPNGGGTHKVRIDGGHVKFNYGGYRYKADTPKTVKRSLMIFDNGDYSSIKPQSYKIVAFRTTKIVPTSPERQAQINAARRKAIEDGKKPQGTVYDLRRRIEGFSGSV